MDKSIIVGSSSEIGQWIATGLSLISREYILISRKDLNAHFKISSYNNYTEIFNVFQEIYSNKSTISSVYFCPGSYTEAYLKDTDPDQWINEFNINFNSAYIIYKALTSSRLLEKADIKLIYLGSTASVSKPIKFSSYVISKAALEIFVSYINNEPPTGIRATCLRLGTCKTQFSNSLEAKNVISKFDVINCVKFIESAMHTLLPELISMRPIKFQHNI